MTPKGEGESAKRSSAPFILAKFARVFCCCCSCAQKEQKKPLGLESTFCLIRAGEQEQEVALCSQMPVYPLLMKEMQVEEFVEKNECG